MNGEQIGRLACFRVDTLGQFESAGFQLGHQLPVVAAMLVDAHAFNDDAQLKAGFDDPQFVIARQRPVELAGVILDAVEFFLVVDRQ